MRFFFFLGQTGLPHTCSPSQTRASALLHATSAPRMRTAVVRRLCVSLRRPPQRRPLHAAAPSCRNRILVEADELRTDSNGGTRVVLGASDARARHVSEVLRAEPGQRIRIGVVDGVRATALLTPGAGVDGSWTLDWSAADEAPRLPAPAVDVLLALPCVPCAGYRSDACSR